MLKFLSLFLGPVFAKEMVEMARRKRYFFNRVLYGLVLLFTLWIVWEEHRFDVHNGKPSGKDFRCRRRIRLIRRASWRAFKSFSSVPIAGTGKPS